MSTREAKAAASRHGQQHNPGSRHGPQLRLWWCPRWAGAMHYLRAWQSGQVQAGQRGHIPYACVKNELSVPCPPPCRAHALRHKQHT